MLTSGSRKTKTYKCIIAYNWHGLNQFELQLAADILPQTAEVTQIVFMCTRIKN